MRATLCANPALGPLVRCVYADVGIALKAATVFTLHCQQRAPAPLAAYTTVAGTELVGFRLGRHSHRSTEALPLNCFFSIHMISPLGLCILTTNPPSTMQNSLQLGRDGRMLIPHTQNERGE